MKKLPRAVRYAMRRAGVDQKAIEQVAAQMDPIKRAPPLSHRMAKKIAMIRAKHGFAIVGMKQVFTPEGWKQRRENGHALARHKAKAGA